MLVFSEGVLSLSHGTGAIFARNFSFYPRDLLANYFIGGGEDPFLAGAVELNRERWRSSPLREPATLPAKLWNRLGLKPTWSKPVNVRALRAATRAQGFQPEIVYAIVYSRTGIDCLRAVLSGLPRKLPVILQIQDFVPTGQYGFNRALRRLAPRVTEVWAVSSAILKTVTPHLRGVPQRLDPLLCTNLPSIMKAEHRPFGPEFRSVIIGNFWNPALLADVRSIWSGLQRQLPGLRPIRWHCHPTGVQYVRAAGFDPGNEVELAPFIGGSELYSMLGAADLALVPFSRLDYPTSDYERFSMPSRLSELCSAGLPIVCLSGQGTPLYEYVIKHRIGLCVPAGDTVRAVHEIAELINNEGRRRSLGIAARRHAETYFQLAPYQKWLGDKLRTLAAVRN